MTVKSAPFPLSDNNNAQATESSQLDQGYPPQIYPPQGSEPTVVIVTQPNFTTQQTFGPIPVQTMCPICSAYIVTYTMYKSGLFTVLLSSILFLCGCIWGCCLIPFCINETKDVIHVCPNCNGHIARWKRL